MGKTGVGERNGVTAVPEKQNNLRSYGRSSQIAWLQIYR